MKSLHMLALALATAAFAATAQPAPGVPQAPQSDGEVRKLDKEQGKLTLRHGPIANLDMPAMTMVFRVADAKVLDTLKVGDKVRFSAEKVDGAYVVTAIQPAQ